MDEERRRNYLAAMGIPVWLPRDMEDPTAAVDAVRESPPAGPELAMPEAPPAVSPPRFVPPPAGSLSLDAPPPWLDDAAPPADIPPAAAPPALVAYLDWEALAERVAQCRACPELVSSRSRTVFGVGNRQAHLMVIGEAPGVDEDRQGEPFVGRAGQLLNAMLGAIGCTREEVYIGNILKCRPAGNRDPEPEEALRCESFLLRQIELVAPTVILSVGRISAQNLLKTAIPVGRLRGRLHHLGAQRIPLVVTYHPAYLLRSPEQKAHAWQDLQLAARILRGLAPS